MKTVLVFGTFDIIHPGHQWFLRNASRLGDRLVAVVSRDSFVREWKGKAAIKDEETRIEALKSSGLVQQAILSDREIRTYGVISVVKPDIICLGHDQKALLEDLEAWIRRTGVKSPEIHVLPPWRRKFYSSSIRNRALPGAGGEGKSTDWLLVIMIITAMSVFGFSWISGKRISSVAAPGTLTFIRFLLSAVFLIPLIFMKRFPEKSKEHRLSGWLWTIAAALAISAFNLLFFMGLKNGQAGKGGLIVTTLNPLFTFFIVSLMGRGRPGKTAAAGMTLGVIGWVLLLEPWHYTFSELINSGNLAFLLAAPLWSLFTLLNRKALDILNFRHFNLRLYILAAILMLPFALIETGGKIPAGMDTSFWIDTVILSAAVGVFGTGVYYIASSKLGAAKTNTFTFLVPISAIFFASVLLGESLEPLMIAGGLLTITAVILINSCKMR